MGEPPGALSQLPTEPAALFLRCVPGDCYARGLLFSSRKKNKKADTQFSVWGVYSTYTEWVCMCNGHVWCRWVYVEYKDGKVRVCKVFTDGAGMCM